MGGTETGALSTELVRVTPGDVSVLTISNPPVNAMGTQLRAELIDVLTALAVTDSAVMVIRGEGKGFSAGADVKEFRGRGGDPVRTLTTSSLTLRLWEALVGVPVPVVAAMHGFAVGAGMVIASLCDIRIAAASLTISMPEIELGISVAGGGAQLRRLGLREGFLRELLYLGEPVGAEVALREGLVDHVFPDEGFDEACLAFAGRIAKHGRSALTAMKTAVDLTESTGTDWRTGLALTRVPSMEFVRAHAKLQALPAGNETEGGRA